MDNENKLERENFVHMAILLRSKWKHTFMTPKLQKCFNYVSAVCCVRKIIELQFSGNTSNHTHFKDWEFVQWVKSGAAE